MSKEKCPHLVEWLDWVILLCEKGKRPYVPTYQEMRSYCKSNNHVHCQYNVLPNTGGEKSDYTMAERNEILT